MKSEVLSNSNIKENKEIYKFTPKLIEVKDSMAIPSD